MGERPAIPFRMLVGRFRLALTLSTQLSDQTRRVAFLLLEMTSRQAYQAGGDLLTWIGAPATAAVLGIDERTAKRARAALASAGIIAVEKPGRIGRGHTATLRFSIAWLARTWEALRARGLLGALGYADDGGADDGGGGTATLPETTKGGDGATLFVGKGGGAATLSDAEKGGGRDTLSPAKGGAAATLPAAGADANGKGDSGATLSRSAPVDKCSGGSVATDERVAAGAEKGDRGVPKRVAALSPKPSDINPGTQPRARARPPVPVPAATAPPAQRSMILPIPGGRSVDGAAAAIAEWRRGLDRKQDIRFGMLLQRAGRLLGDQGQGSLAVSCLDLGLRQRILAGAQIRDPELLGALRAALDQLQPPAAGPAAVDAAPGAATSGTAPAGDGGLGDRMTAMERRFDRIEAMLMRALGGAAVAVG